ncbi:hypothetical protein [Psychrobacter sp. I-STPA6b]|uniref:hypothetical protein n=1 Tax=Psychrobacter sp. I-STPA6b TaxID=2585718 RepID=UPI001D0CBA19|nr:hypothetical protein [Psychrobacter sp. I-STPA6b]
MKAFKITALALASSLLLAGCGGSGDSTTNNTGNTGGIPTKPETDNSLKPIDQAKEMVNTAKLFISDNKAIADAYESAGDIVTKQQMKRWEESFSMPESLAEYMQKNKLSVLDAQKIKQLIKTDDFYLKGLDNLVPADDFKATLDPQGKFELSGSSELTLQKNIDYVYNPQTGRYEEQSSQADTFSVRYQGYEQTLFTNTVSTATPKLTVGFESMTIGSGDEELVVKSSKDSLKGNAILNKAVVVNDDFDLGDEHKNGVRLNQLDVALNNVTLIANGNIVTAKDLSFSMLDITKKLNNGQEAVRSIPYQFALTGQLLKEEPSTNVSLSLSTVANKDDVKNVLTFNENEKVIEGEGKFLPLTTTLSVQGTVSKKGASQPIPLDFQAHIKRTARDKFELQGLTAKVDKKTLFIEGSATLNSDYGVVAQEYTVKQNDAQVILKVDKNGEFVTDANNKLGDITVNGKRYGELFKSKGMVTARFTDDTTIVL